MQSRYSVANRQTVYWLSLLRNWVYGWDGKIKIKSSPTTYEEYLMIIATAKAYNVIIE
jgi:hypothetical protein